MALSPLLLKCRRWWAVDLRNRSTRLAAVRWLSSGHELYLLKAETAKEISGLVASAMYISEPTIACYSVGSAFLSSLSLAKSSFTFTSMGVAAP